MLRGHISAVCDLGGRVAIRRSDLTESMRHIRGKFPIGQGHLITIRLCTNTIKMEMEEEKKNEIVYTVVSYQEFTF